MSYIVSASDQARAVEYRRGSMIAALEQGLALIGCGLENVAITDLQGHARTPAEFARFVANRNETGAAKLRRSA